MTFMVLKEVVNFFNKKLINMKSFEQFQLENQEFVFGGELYPTYIGENGDFYDSDTGRFIILLK